LHPAYLLVVLAIVAALQPSAWPSKKDSFAHSDNAPADCASVQAIVRRTWSVSVSRCAIGNKLKQVNLLLSAHYFAYARLSGVLWKGLSAG